MNTASLVFCNISRSRFRSWVIALSAALVAGVSLAGAVISHGTRVSLRTALERVGADILVVPTDGVQQVETALLMGVPTRTFMPDEVLRRIEQVPGVLKASPQLYLSTLRKASCCSVGELFLVAYDPATDFTLTPWLEHEVPGGLKVGEAIGGTYVAAPDGQNVTVYGSALTLKTNLAPTGTGIDQTLFFTFETAQAVARNSIRLAEAPLVIPERSISAVLVRIDPRFMVANVAFSIQQLEAGVSAISSPRLFQSYRQQMNTVRGALSVLLLATVGAAMLIVGLVFTLATHERRRDIGVLRALGATKAFVFGTLITEAAVLSLVGGVFGAALSALAVFLFHELFVVTLGVPFVLPSPLSLSGAGAITVGLAVVISTLATAWPGVRMCTEEPARAMRERT